MATYTELAAIQADSSYGGLQAKIRAAVAVKAVAMLDAATPTANEIEWALSALGNPASVAESVAWYVIAANKAATTAQILSASDNAVQTNVDAAVDALVVG